MKEWDKEKHRKRCSQKVKKWDKGMKGSGKEVRVRWGKEVRVRWGKEVRVRRGMQSSTFVLQTLLSDIKRFPNCFHSFNLNEISTFASFRISRFLVKNFSFFAQLNTIYSQLIAALSCGIWSPSTHYSLWTHSATGLLLIRYNILFLISLFIFSILTLNFHLPSHPSFASEFFGLLNTLWHAVYCSCRTISETNNGKKLDGDNKGELDKMEITKEKNVKYYDKTKEKSRVKREKIFLYKGKSRRNEV